MNYTKGSAQIAFLIAGIISLFILSAGIVVKNSIRKNIPVGSGGQVVSASIGGSNTQVQFNNSGSFGGSTNFVWDNTNNRLGIGTTSPGFMLSIKGPFLANGTSTIEGGSLIAQGLHSTSSLAFYTASNETPRVKIDESGNVGIGTAGPNDALQVGTVLSNGKIRASFINLGTNGTTGSQLTFYGVGTNYGQIAVGTGATSNWSLGYNGNPVNGSVGINVLTWNESGNVGIGTTSPFSTLSLNGLLSFSTSSPPTMGQCSAGGTAGAFQSGATDNTGKIKVGTTVTTANCQIIFNTRSSQERSCVVNDETDGTTVWAVASSTGAAFKTATDFNSDVINYICF